MCYVFLFFLSHSICNPHWYTRVFLCATRSFTQLFAPVFPSFAIIRAHITLAHTHSRAHRCFDQFGGGGGATAARATCPTCAAQIRALAISVICLLDRLTKLRIIIMITLNCALHKRGCGTAPPWPPNDDRMRGDRCAYYNGGMCK